MKPKGMLFLALPFEARYPSGVQLNVQIAIKKAIRLIDAGYTVYLPHYLWLFKEAMPNKDLDFEVISEKVIPFCSAVVVEDTEHLDVKYWIETAQYWNKPIYEYNEVEV